MVWWQEWIGIDLSMGGGTDRSKVLRNRHRQNECWQGFLQLPLALPRGTGCSAQWPAQGEGPPTGPGARVRCYNPPRSARLQRVHVNAPPFFRGAMTSEQAAQLIDNALDLVHQRLQDLEAQALPHEHKALAAEFREWRQPSGGHIDLMVFPGLSNS